MWRHEIKSTMIVFSSCLRLFVECLPGCINDCLPRGINDCSESANEKWEALGVEEESHQSASLRNLNSKSETNQKQIQITMK